jgi:3-oxosteroid 1-dehydrogenase
VKICCGSFGQKVDVLVVGSGGSGLTAALAALEAGATVAVIEKNSMLGGTTALSGGMIWIPCNKHARAAGIEDSFEQALRYAVEITKGRASMELLKAHLKRGDQLLEFFERAGGLRYSVVGSFPDYHPEFDGGSSGGRSLEPELFDAKTLGPLQAYLRDDPRPPFLQREYFEEWKTFKHFPWYDLEQRREDGMVARGLALVAPLVKAIADRGGTIAASLPAERLLVEDGCVIGVRTPECDIRAGAVVLASGGFEWSDELCNRFLSGPVDARCSTPANVGDGLRMGMSVGADLANMSEAWWGVYAKVPGTEVDGESLGTIVTVERSLPGSIVVNKRGERFTNEAGSYYAFGKVLAAFDASSYDYRNLPAYIIGDAGFFRRYGLLGVDSFDQLSALAESTESLIAIAESLEDLAGRLEIDPERLVATVARFNGFAGEGCDPDFFRGESVYDRYFGDEMMPHPNLAPLVEPPFFALQIHCGAIGTKGGIRTDVEGRALDPWGAAIEGLFAVGNVSAHPIAFGYLGAGTTLGPSMTMALAAGRAAAQAVSVKPV